MGEHGELAFRRACERRSTSSYRAISANAAFERPVSG
jgi:hypothetical protein